MEWVARITTVALVMVLPGVGGLWLDRQFGSRYWGLLGFLGGFMLGISALLAMVKRPRR